MEKHLINAIHRVHDRMEKIIENQQKIENEVLKGRYVSYEEYQKLVPPIHPTFGQYAAVYARLHDLLDELDPFRVIKL